MQNNCYLQPLASPPRARMRAVIADSDPVRRSLLRRAFLSDPAFELAAEVSGSDELLHIIERTLPELVIGSLCCFLENLDLPEAFPVLIGPGTGPVSSERVICRLPLPWQESEVAEALATAAARILHLKAGELSSLVRNYLAYGDELRKPLERIAVDEGDRQISVSTEDILWVKAAGNYVRLHTRTGSFELRDTLSNLAAKLERSGFTRIHRGVVVNTGTIKHRALRDGMVAAVVLEDGTHLLVGRKFRHRLPPETSDASVLPTPHQALLVEGVGQGIGS